MFHEVNCFLEIFLKAQKLHIVYQIVERQAYFFVKKSSGVGVAEIKLSVGAQDVDYG